MEPFSLLMLAGGIVAAVAWSMVDNLIHDREGRRRKRIAEAQRLSDRAEVLRSRR